MLWGLPVFFGLLVLCAVLYGCIFLRERLRPEQSATCTLRERRREVDSSRVLIHKREREIFYQVYRTEQEEEITLTVSRAVYNAIAKDVPGVLVYRGNRFVSFTADGQTVTELDAERWQAMEDRRRYL